MRLIVSVILTYVLSLVLSQYLLPLSSKQTSRASSDLNLTYISCFSIIQFQAALFYVLSTMLQYSPLHLQSMCCAQEK